MQARAIVNAAPGPRAEVRARADLRINALGSGSDYSPFLQHAGIASLNLGFGGLDQDDGIYHSIYDDYYSFHEVSRFRLQLRPRPGADGRHSRDQAFRRRTCCHSEFSHLAETAQTYQRELQTLLRERQDEVRERNRQIEDGVLAAVADRRRPARDAGH